MISVLDFFNLVRTQLRLDELPCVWLSGAEEDDETSCIVAGALDHPVGASAYADWNADSRWVIRLPGPATARVVGVGCGLDWRAEPPEVALPVEVIDLAVSHHFAAVESDELGALAAWWVLDRHTGEWQRFDPTEPLIASEYGVLPYVA